VRSFFPQSLVFSEIEEQFSGTIQVRNEADVGLVADASWDGTPGMTRIDRDRRIYEDLVRSHGGNLYRFAYRLCGDADMADDLVQETFFEAWRSIHSLRDPESGRSWLFQILRHRRAHGIRDRSRRVQPTADLERLVDVADNAGVDVLAKLSNQELLRLALEALNEQYREPFLLVFLEDFTCRETAELLSIPLGTVLSRIHRARQFLRRLLRQLDAADEPQAARTHGQHEGKGSL
jgi:RNA polymerase sigma-70 factor (ECF subfamily)